MKCLQIVDFEKLSFIKLLFDIEGQNPFQLSLQRNSICNLHDLIADLLNRFIDEETTVLPFITQKNNDYLLILNPSSIELHKHSEEIRSFISPLFIHFDCWNYSFFKSEKAMGEYGVRLFPDGYFLLSVPHSMLEKTLESVHAWHIMDRMRPEADLETQSRSVFSLRSNFHQALAINQWDEAENLLIELRSGHYLSDENCLFLKIQLLAMQSRWKEIWKSEDYEVISQLDPLPISVKAALLHAFYYCALCELESNDNWEMVIETININRPIMGTLLRSYSGLSGEPIIRIFLYQAILDKNTEVFRYLIGQSKDQRTEDIIIILKAMLPLQTVVNCTSEERFKEAKRLYNEKLYDDAYLCLLDLPANIANTELLLAIAAETKEIEIIEEGFRVIELLSKEDQEQLTQDKRTQHNLEVISTYKPGLIISENKTPHTWLEWFQAIHSNQRGLNYLLDQMEKFSEPDQRILWNSKHISEISTLLMDFFVNSEALKNEQISILKITLPEFIAFILKGEKYPTEFEIDLYEYAIACLQVWGRKNEINISMIFGLLDGLLYIDPEKLQSQWDEIEGWMDFRASRIMSGIVLEILELFYDYGIVPDQLHNVWYKWVANLVDQFTPDMNSEVQSWGFLGSQIGADSTLLTKLQANLTEREDEYDVLSSLNGIYFVIFSCREKAAKRAAERIIMRNPTLRVQICSDDRLTEQAEIFARHCDIAILITTCTSHALTIGIMPLLKNPPIYPRSSGETGIIEALEVWGKKE